MTTVSSPDVAVAAARADESRIQRRDANILELQRAAALKRRFAGPKSAATTVLSLVLLVAIWQLLVVLLNAPSYALPSPASVFTSFFTQLPLLAEQSLPTLGEILIGFGVTVVIFVPLGIAIAQWRWVEGLVNPLLVISQSTPSIAFAPLLITWWGLGMLPKVVMVILICFFPVVVNTVVGIKSVAPEVIDLGRSMGASPLAMLLRVRIPGALPSIFAGLRVAMPLAVIGAIVAEFTGADVGLGRVIVSANGRLNTSLVFAAIIAIAIIGLVLYKLIERLEWVSIPWHRNKRER